MESRYSTVLGGEEAGLEESDPRQPIRARICLAIAALGHVRVTVRLGTMMLCDVILSRIGTLSMQGLRRLPREAARGRTFLHREA